VGGFRGASGSMTVYPYLQIIKKSLSNGMCTHCPAEAAIR
jgi:hypothetical protein